MLQPSSFQLVFYVFKIGMCHRDSLFTELQTSDHCNLEVTRQKIASSIFGSFVNQKSKKYV